MRTVTRTIFSKRLRAGETEHFSYRPQPCEVKATGLLIGRNVEALSLSFENGTELLFNQLAPCSLPDFPPDSRVILLDYPLNGKLIKGMVKAGFPYQADAEVKERLFMQERFGLLANIYLITENKDDEHQR